MKRRLRFGPAEADVRTDLGQEDQADADAVRGEDVDAVVAVADPAGGRVDVALRVAADAVGEAGELAAGRRHLHRDELAPAGELRAVDDVVGPDVAGRLGIVGRAGVGDVEGLVVGGEAEAVGFEELVGDLREFADRSGRSGRRPP